ncbi:PliI family lysozyme inhibitor of I-type lysozyme [Shewanella gaetbuli]|uniref:Uncharacterized protein n=1 Tax=Shewanella gaetbuli TaxID=220752 RepID=A0A9X2CHX0_9GAMM|nr:PliI family lysozyme inhibitor of I-type lysozyme [Shewanella gaetbuli]MCL1143973.1 hypothetical protein [Shewanella gaetbuli]
MKLNNLFGLLIMLSLCCFAHKVEASGEVSQHQDAGYLKAFIINDHITIVVEEGQLEPRSIGSITVKLYHDLSVGDFISAVSFPRDGTIAGVEILDDMQAINITTVSAGSGSYQNIQQVCFTPETLMLCKENQ